MHASPAAGRRLSGELAAARIVAFPLRGEWTAVRTPGSRIPSHGTDMLGQRFAIDLMRLDRRGGGRYHPASALRVLVLGVPTRECHGWGEPVLSVLPGQVVEAADGMAERARVHPVRDLLLVLRNGLMFRPDRLGALMGNHVILRHGDVWSAYAHLAPGSVAVQAGQTVDAGVRLGAVGHTGNSTAPHLHVQLMDGPDALTAAGVPMAFRRYEIETPAGWIEVRDSVPLASERIRSTPREDATERSA